MGNLPHRLVGRNLEGLPGGAKGPTIEKAGVRVCLKLQRRIRANEDGGRVPSSAQNIYVLALQVVRSSGRCAVDLGRSLGVQTAKAVVAPGLWWLGTLCPISVKPEPPEPLAFAAVASTGCRNGAPGAVVFWPPLRVEEKAWSRSTDGSTRSRAFLVQCKLVLIGSLMRWAHSLAGVSKGKGADWRFRRVSQNVLGRGTSRSRNVV